MAKKFGHPEKQFWADSRAGIDIRWFLPADFNVADDSEDAANATGWFFRGPRNIWQGPFHTSELAAIAFDHFNKGQSNG